MTKSDQVVLSDILEADPDPKYTLSDTLWATLQRHAAKHKAAGNGFGYQIAPKDGVTRTLTARYRKDGSEILVGQEGKNPRRLTPRECFRLQGFPDDLFEKAAAVCSDTQLYKQAGNAVTVSVAYEMGKWILNSTIEN